MRARLHLSVRGLVQGVGFRPFVYRLAVARGLDGAVWNTSEGVEIEIEGPPEAVESFRDALEHEPPPAARVDAVLVSKLPPSKEAGFRILRSEARDGESALLGPDLGPCEACLRELAAPSDRRFLHPFINCTNCGPRFSIVRELPYDRPRTTLAPFPMCPVCAAEYQDPLDRRYHAQPVACPACGPQARLVLDPSRPDRAEEGDPLREAASRLAGGSLLAIRGVGGFLLCCDARCEESVQRLRTRKHRPHRPLALMARDLDEVRGICHLSPDEEAALASSTRPILLLRRREALPAEREVAHAVAPLHAFLGVMLPSAPLFSVLFEHGAPPLLVATSGNRSGAPLARTNEAAFRDLAGVADAFLVHDREIHNRCDDSVGYVASGESPGEVGRLVLLRRARGFAPLPLPLPSPVAPSLAVGAMLASTVALAEGHRVFPSQHLGDTDDLDTLEFLEEAVERLQRWLRIEPELLACDLHPDLPSTHLARRLAGSRPLHRVQHHHAHLAAAATAAGLRFDEEALALVLDGTGYGPDGAIWGCEALVGSAVLARRVGHLRPVRLPGGDHAIRRPRRVAAAWLHAALPGSEALPLRLWDAFEDDELAVLRRMMDRAFNAPWTTSAGRLFDAVAAILGFGGTVSYEGQAAVELEQAAWRASRPFPLPLPVEEKEGLWRLDPGPLLDALVRAVLRGEAREALAMGFHEALARALVELCRGLREGGAPDRVLLAGGVFQNRILTQRLLRLLREAGMRPLPPGTLPIGDGGLSVGQVAVANARGPGQPGVLVAESPVHPEAP